MNNRSPAGVALAAMIALIGTSAGLGGQGFRAPLPLGELVLTADAIVIGEITAVDEDAFTLRIERRLDQEGADPGAPTGTRIEKFPAAETSPRWAPYEAGQALLLFLEAIPCAQRRGDAAWRILGRIGEGEIPLADGYAYFPGRTIEGPERAYHRIYGEEIYIQRLDRETAVSAIVEYRDCFVRAPATDAEESAAPVAVCSPDELARYADRSPLHTQLAREAESPPRP